MDKDLAAAPKQHGELPEPLAWLYQHKTIASKSACVVKRMDPKIAGADEWWEMPVFTADQLRTAIAAEREHQQNNADNMRQQIADLRAENFKLAAGQCVNATADDGGTPYCSELSTLRQHLAEAVRERDALRSVVQSALNNNGGPIDADSTLDGKSYVMVLREDFDAIDAASRVAGT